MKTEATTQLTSKGGYKVTRPQSGGMGAVISGGFWYLAFYLMGLLLTYGLADVVHNVLHGIL